MAAELPEEQAEWFWIDAICINQQDLSERASQVQLMGKIYSSASWVIVRLGDFDCGCQTHSDNCTCLSQRELEAAFKWSSSIYDACGRLGVDEMTLPETAEFLPSGEIYRSLGRLYSRPWFSRMWVFQEVTLPSDHQRVFAFCGTAGINFNCLLKTSEYLRKLESVFDLLSDDEMLDCLESVNQAASLCFIRDQMIGTMAVKLDIGVRLAHTLLYTSGMFDCTDERDKLYGLYGFIQDIDTVPSLRPNYSKPVDEAYYEAARYIIESTGTLTLLSAAPNIRGGPSWVPTWKRRVVPLTSVIEDESDLYARFRSHTHFQFSACGRRLTARVLSLGDIAYTVPIPRLPKIYDLPSFAEFIRSTMISLGPLMWWQKKYPTIEHLEIGLVTAVLWQVFGALLFDDDLVHSYEVYTGRSSWPGKLKQPSPSLDTQIAKVDGQLAIFSSVTAPTRFSICMTTQGYITVTCEMFPDDCRFFLVPGCYQPLVFVRENDSWRIHEYNVVPFTFHDVNSDTWDQHIDGHFQALARNEAWEDITIS
jgi:hypothetical protein